jgi:hypothetical protein
MSLAREVIKLFILSFYTSPQWGSLRFYFFPLARASDIADIQAAVPPVCPVGRASPPGASALPRTFRSGRARLTTAAALPIAPLVRPPGSSPQMGPLPCRLLRES